MDALGTDRDWLVRLRWGLLAVAGGLLGSAALGGADLPWAALVGLLALGAASNAGLWALRRRLPSGPTTVAVALAVDVWGLTAFLALSGGANNPFSFLYLLLLATGALLLPVPPTVALTVGIGGAYATLFALPQPPHDHRAMERHLQGMWLAYAVCGPLLAAVVHTLRARAATAERRRSDAEAAAARAERLAGLATLAAGAAHEIASPLGTIAVVAGELARSEDPSVRADGDLLAREVERCRAVLDQLSTHAGAGPVDGVGRVALGVVVAAAAGAAPVRDDAPGAEVAASPRLLGQALRRLVANAERSGGPVEVHVDAAGDHVRVRVIDRGTGMSPEVLARVGEPFYTTHGGMGLGVYFARSVVDACGGRLSFESAPGQGTTATVVLPRAPEVR